MPCFDVYTLGVAGISILLIPFSFDFVDALCIATVLGFLCEFGDKLGRRWSARRGNGGTVAVAAMGDMEENHTVSGPVTITTAAGETSTTAAANREFGTTDALLRPKFLPSLRSEAEVLQIASAPASPRGERVPLTKGKTLQRNIVLPPLQIKKESTAPRSDSSPRNVRVSPKRPTDVPAGPVSIHWGLALVAAAQLVLSVIRDQTQDE